MARANLDNYAFDAETLALVREAFDLTEQDFKDRLTDQNRPAFEAEAAAAIAAMTAGGQRDVNRLRVYAASKAAAFLKQSPVPIPAS
jgi:hypothetical protein